MLSRSLLRSSPGSRRPVVSGSNVGVITLALGTFTDAGAGECGLTYEEMSRYFCRALRMTDDVVSWSR